jgi:hypothetical protein
LTFKSVYLHLNFTKSSKIDPIVTTTKPMPVQSVLVIQGPNLNLLGSRQPTIYGHETLNDIHARLQRTAQSAGVSLTSFQSNHEGALVDRIQQAPRDGVDFILMNPGAYTHTSVAMRFQPSTFLLLKYIFLTFTRAKLSDTVHLSRISRSGPFAGSAAEAMTWH